jgi:putative hydrolase of the HAD superfamily
MPGWPVGFILFDFWETIFGFLSKEALETVRSERIAQFALVLDAEEAEVEGSFVKSVAKLDTWRKTTGMEFTVEELVMEMLKHMNKGSEFLPSLSQLYTEVVFRHLPGPLEGTANLLEHLKTKGIPTAIVSNTIHGPIERKLLKLHGFEAFFDALIFSSEVGLRKPRPEIFQAALDMLGAEPENTVHVGDNVEADIEGALAAGLRAVHINYGYGTGLTHPKVLPAKNLDEVRLALSI